MFGYIKALVTLISSLVNFVINTIKSLVMLLGLIPTYSATLITAINYLPAFLIPFFLACLSIYIIQYVIGRKAD